jgi:hypothetical protein
MIKKPVKKAVKKKRLTTAQMRARVAQRKKVAAKKTQMKKSAAHNARKF